MAIKRVALIFDDTARPETTGVYCRNALAELVQVEHFRPPDLNRIPRQGFDLYLQIDDGLEYHHPPDLRPSAWWVIDTHMNLDWCLTKARDFDVVFAAQRDGAERMREKGIPSATWLPLACDPQIHRKQRCKKKYDFCFVGNVFRGPRADLLGAIERKFGNHFVGRVYFEEMARIYSASRMVFNRSILDDVNMRVFEALCCGSLLITNDLRQNGQHQLFQDGHHLATYGDVNELLDKITYYLAHEDVRERIASAGRKEVLARHTYRHRMERILAQATEFVGSTRIHDTPAPKSKNAVTPSPMIPTASGSGKNRDPSYFDFARPELLELVPGVAQRILDIGCGAGRLGEAIKARQGAYVVGIEYEQAAAERAKNRLDRVLVGDIEQMEPDFPAGSFDAVVCGDVLEHLRDPARMLARIRTWLHADGCLVASIPNVRHHSVVHNLLAGNWTYESAGLLDSTHLRFFTRREIEKLFYRSGLSIQTFGMVAGPGDTDFEKQVQAGTVKMGSLQIGGLPPDEAQEFYAYQYLLTATPAQMPDYGLTSIVIITHNELPYTIQCLDSIRRYTDQPYELIVVDNASTDGTTAYLRAADDVRLIASPENYGFPKAANQGIRAATGKQVLLLNNDTIVTTGWLDRMLRALQSDPHIGLVGPCTNNISGEQRVEVTYDDLGALDGFAWDWGKAQNRTLQETDRLVGFCLLIRRELIDRIGLLDEQFGIGCFEDDDYCLRARNAGIKGVIARDAFVHHFGSRTFIGSGADFYGVMKRNQEIFENKWGASAVAPEAMLPASPPPILRTPTAAKPLENGLQKPQPLSRAELPREQPMAGFEICRAARGGLILSRKKIILSLTMIVRDNERTIAAARRSIRPWVDEMIVVDTGSADRTPEIAQSLGARVYSFPWCDDFSAARNEALKYARGNWIFWMDSDDTIDEANGRKLRELVRRPLPDALLGYTMKTRCPSTEDGADDFTEVDQLHVFRNLPYLHWDGMIHEQMISSINRAGGSFEQTDLFVVHSGSDRTPEGQARKLERDFRILHNELAARPHHPFTLFNLGMTYRDAKEHEKAERYLRQSIHHSQRHESQLRKTYAYLLDCCQAQGKDDEAWQACSEGLGLFPEDAELRFMQAGLLHRRGKSEEAAKLYRDLLKTNGQEYLRSSNRGITGFIARQNLAAALSDLNDLPGAESQLRLVVEEMPRYKQGWLGLADVLLRQRKLDETAALLPHLEADSNLRSAGLVIEAQVASARGNHETARRLFAQAVVESPADIDTRDRQCRFLFEHGEPAETEQAVRELLALDPGNAAALHNLGAVLSQQRRLPDAIGAFQESLRLRPKAAGTWAQFGNALMEQALLPEARDAFERALQLAPGDTQAANGLATIEQLLH